MPRKARLDAPGALHHIICRGIEQRKIFDDDADRDNFLHRLRIILKKTSTPCYGWALIPNHFHLLLRTGKIPISTVMRRLSTGYAVSFNRRHRRYGHQFQNRYGGHSVLMGKQKRDFQDVDYVLQLFDDKVAEVRRNYREYVRKRIDLARRPELVGGGLLRSTGGWAVLIAMNKIDSGYEFKLNKMRNAFFHDRPYLPKCFFLSRTSKKCDGKSSKKCTCRHLYQLTEWITRQSCP